MLGDINSSLLSPKYELTLCKPTGEQLSTLVEATNITYNPKLKYTSQLSFTIPFYIRKNGIKVKNPNFDLILGGYQILLNNSHKFIILDPEKNGEAYKDYVTATCMSLEYENKGINVRGYKVDSRKLYTFPSETGLDRIDEDGYYVGVLNEFMSNSSWTVDEDSLQELINAGFNQFNYLASTDDITANGTTLKYRSFDISDGTGLDFLEEIQKAFDCIFAYDTLNRKIQVKVNDTLGENKGLYISDTNILKKINIKVKDDDKVVTVLQPIGKDNLTIHELTPDGTGKLYDFSFYKNLTYMSQGLINALNAYDTLYTNSKSTYTGYLNQLNGIDEDITAITHTSSAYVLANPIDLSQCQVSIGTDPTGTTYIKSILGDIPTYSNPYFSNPSDVTIGICLDELTLIYKEIQSNKDVAIANSTTVLGLTSTQWENNEKLFENIQKIGYIDKKNAIITAKESEKNAINANITSLQSSLLRFDTETVTSPNFTSAQQIELRQWIKEKPWNNEYISDATELYNEALIYFAKVNNPVVEFTLDSQDITQLISYQHDWSKLVNGDLVNLDYPNFNLNDLEIRLIEYIHTPESQSLELKFSSKYSIDDVFLQMNDILRVTSKQSKVLEINKPSWNSANLTAIELQNAISDMSSDSKLTPSEKLTIRKEWRVIQGEKPLMDSKADTFLIVDEKTDYDNTYITLNDLILPLLANMTVTSTIDRLEFNTAFFDYYGKRDLLNSACENTVNGAVNALILDIASDNKLITPEKRLLRKEWNTIAAEKNSIDTQADDYSVDRGAYDSAYTALEEYLVPLLNNLGITSDIDSEEFLLKFSTYYTEKTKLLNAITTKIRQLSIDDLTNYVNVTTYSSGISGLQNQIDGNITSWFLSGSPSLANAPANTWTTTGLKDAHLGDLYYDTVTKHAYRFMVSGGVYSWDLITDTDIATALANAATAKDTADSKRRVFVTTPTVPYDIGDLWAGGSSGDLKRCKTAKAVGGAYSSLDWELASKYTDDSTANSNNTAIRADLKLTAPLPTSISMDSYGITATTSDATKYARLDYRGLFIEKGAIQINSTGGSAYITGDYISLPSAGLSNEGSTSSSIRIFAGSTYSNRGSAVFRVQQDGKVYASNIEIVGGSINVSSDAYVGQNMTLQIGAGSGKVYFGGAGSVGFNLTSGAVELSSNSGLNLTASGIVNICSGLIKLNDSGSGYYVNIGSSGGVHITDANELKLSCAGSQGGGIILGISNSKIGFYGTTPLGRLTVTALGATVTTETAPATYTSTAQSMLDHLKTEITTLRTTVASLLAKLGTSSGVGLFT